MAVPAEIQSALSASAPDHPAAQSLLTRPFKALLFDWDGTAVVNRQEDASALAHLAESLLDAGVYLIIVTGAPFAAVDRQFCAHVAPALRRHLIACVNHGSEVYRFDETGAASLAWSRVATPAEQRALDATAEAVREHIRGQSGPEIAIIANRLNRRKIDLIPAPDWADPSRERIAELRDVVERRLDEAGFAGGLHEAVRLTERVAAEQGLADPRIACDVKYIQIGLTDKRDVVAWLRAELLEPAGIAPRDVLILGDEFGPIAGFDGGDDRLRAGMPGAVVVSLGREPEGVPEGVLHLGGGPARFRVLLAAQSAVQRERWADTGDPIRAATTWPLRDRLDALFDAPADPQWRLAAEGYDPALERDVESLFAVGNGFLGIRGSLDDITTASQPRTFVAGLFNTPDDALRVPAIVSAPDWMRLRLFRDDEPIPLTGDENSGERVLDLRRGILHGDCTYEHPALGSLSVRTVRFASLAERRVAVQIARVEATRPCTLALEAWTDAPGPDLVAEQQTPSLATYRTADGKRRLALASHAGLRLDGREVAPATELVTGHRSWSWEAQPGRPAIFVRLVALSRDTMDPDPEAAARAALEETRGQSLVHLHDEHVRAWNALWSQADVEIEGDDEAQRALRFAAYHLLSAANPDDDRVSVGARALTGEGYKGHVFWDTDIYLLPFYCHAWPEAARAMLLYRYHTLGPAREKAARLGYKGALYAWESADTGEETTPTELPLPNGEVITVRCGVEEHHISADVAYAVWQYWRVTGDDAFLLAHGAEILLETARFWASRPTLEADGRWHIRGVIGPDEYHEGVDDDAYTNAMAAWNLDRGVEVARLLAARWPDRWAELRARLALTDDELAQWRTVADGLVIRRAEGRDGLLEQFEGFFGKEYIDLSSYTPQQGTMEVLYGQRRLRGSQIIKQADVVMLTALVPEAFAPEAIAENFRYYEPRTAHGSSLSPAMYALVAARLGDVEMAHRYFHRAAAIDLDNSMRNAAHGVHIATAGGLWMAAVQGFAGLCSAAPDALRLDPHLPAAWNALRFPVQWHGRRVRCEVARAEDASLRVTIMLERGEALPVAVGDLRATLAEGQAWTCARDGDGRWREEGDADAEGEETA